MTDAPSPIASSTAGLPSQARDTIEAGAARRAGQHNATRRQAQTVTDAGATVETTDADARVFGDTEGTGSQGRDSVNRTPTRTSTSRQRTRRVLPSTRIETCTWTWKPEGRPAL